MFQRSGLKQNLTHAFLLEVIIPSVNVAAAQQFYLPQVAMALMLARQSRTASAKHPKNTGKLY